MKEKLGQLMDLKGYIESETFQANIMNPLFKEMDKLKDAYDCQSLRELSEMKGKKWGLKWLIKRLKDIEMEIKNLDSELREE